MTVYVINEAGSRMNHLRYNAPSQTFSGRRSALGLESLVMSLPHHTKGYRACEPTHLGTGRVARPCMRTVHRLRRGALAPGSALDRLTLASRQNHVALVFHLRLQSIARCAIQCVEQPLPKQQT